MSETKPVSPLLDGFDMGASMGSHDGVTCYPALKENTDNKYIVKFISVPPSQVQLEALLLTGAYKDPADALDYFKEVADGIVTEAEILSKLSRLDGFLPYENWKIIPMENGKLGYEVCLIGSYKRSLARYLRRSPMTHLEVVNLGLDLCQSLAISRRAGYLYVDLKPENVFISKGREYRIGDLGFVPIDSLAYTSLPGRYRSAYSPREVQDDFNPLNDTVDTYAVGMILYQIYNDGNLPAMPKDTTEVLPTPANADYEIAEIILKALSPDPADRWHDPMEMGQALVAYMQRNTVNNTPILSPIAVLPEVGEPAVKPAPQKEVPAEVTPEPTKEVPAAEESAAVETAAEVPAAPEAEEAAEAAAAAVAVADPPAQEAAIDEDDLDFAKLLSPEYEYTDDDREFPIGELMPEPPVRNRKKGWIVALVLILVLLLGGLGIGGFWFYQNMYLQNIDSLIVDGSQSQITVSVSTSAEETLLTVICSDSYGNSVRKPLGNGQAVFTELLPNSQYKIRLETEGFHELTGQTTAVFHTEAQTHVVSISAITGPEDGSVVLNFTVDGGEPDEWTVTYSTEGEEEQSQTFTGHTVTLRGLTVGKTYLFHLDSSDDLALLGKITAEFTASQLITAQNLTIVSCDNGILNLSWNAPEDVVVEEWDVRCYNDQGQEMQATIKGATEAFFRDIDPGLAYTVEVTARGMTQPARVSLTANPLTVSDITVNEEDPEKLTVSWDYIGNTPEGGWLLIYRLDDSPTSNVVKCDQPTGVISPRIHGAKYTFQIQTSDGTTVFNSTQDYYCPNPQIFSKHSLSAERITANMLVTPAKENWSYKDINKDFYTSTFHSGEKMSVMLFATANFYIPDDPMNVLFVIRDGEGNVIPELIGQLETDWKDLWLNTDYHYCELDLPKVPTEPGKYSLSLYFNGLAVTVTTFTIEA